MKYEIKKIKQGYHSGYQIGTGYKQGLTWQPAAIGYVGSLFVVLVALAALAAFITPKLLLLGMFVLVGYGMTYSMIHDAKLHSAEEFKLFPYRKNKWRDHVTVIYNNEMQLMHTLNDLLKYKELDNFIDRNEIMAEVFTALKLYESKKINETDLEEYREVIRDLIDECEKAQHRGMLAGKESHDSNVKAALEVAKKVNGDLL